MTCHTLINCALLQEPYALACGDVFHTSCITTFAEVAKVPLTHVRCPTCNVRYIDSQVHADECYSEAPEDSFEAVQFLLGGNGARRSGASNSGSNMPGSPDVMVMEPKFSQSSIPPGQPTQLDTLVEEDDTDGAEDGAAAAAAAAAAAQSQADVTKPMPKHWPRYYEFAEVTACLREQYRVKFGRQRQGQKRTESQMEEANLLEMAIADAEEIEETAPIES